MQENLENSNFSVDPIGNFYDKYKQSSKQIITETTTEWLKNAKEVLDDTITQHQNKIKQLQTEINQKFEQEKIKSKKISNIVIIVFSCLIIGLFFLGILVKNKKIIKSFEEFKTKKEQEIQIQKEDLFNIVYTNLRTLKTSELLSQIFSNYELRSTYKVNTDIFQFDGLIAINNANIVYLNNTPIYDLNIKEVNMRNVITTGSIDVKEKKGDKMVERTITATHSEPTPYIDTFNQICLMSNYLQPQFSLISQARIQELQNHERNNLNNANVQKQGMFGKLKQKVNNKIDQLAHKDENFNGIKLENDLFNKEIHFKYEGSEIEIAQFFGLKVQEDFVRWNENYTDITNRSYGFKNHIFYDEKALSIPFNSYYESVLETCNYNTPDKVASMQMDALRNSLIDIISSYLEDWFKAVQLPLLVTGINREWYQVDGIYKVGFNLTIDQMNSFTSTTYLINKWRKMLCFKSETPKRDTWIKIADEKSINENLVYYDVDLNSYGSKLEIDKVKREGYEVPVKYEVFYKISEPKKAYRFKINKWLENTNIQFTITKNNTNKSIASYSVDIRNILKDTIIDISDTLLVSKTEQYQNILKKLVQFMKLNDQFNQHCTLVLSNEYDGLILVDDVEWFDNKFNQNAIINLVNDLNS